MDYESLAFLSRIIGKLRNPNLSSSIQQKSLRRISLSESDMNV